VYAGITPYGATKMHKVAGTTNFKSEKHYKNKKGDDAKSITIEAYCDVVKDTFLPEGERLMGHSHWVLQQDNDPTHKKGSTAALSCYNTATKKRKRPSKSVDERDVKVLAFWPPHSPDLSPIENCWSLVQRKVDAAGCKTTAQFQAKVMEEFENLSTDYLQKLYASMEKRIEECIAKGGDRINY
jgi:transposase